MWITTEKEQQIYEKQDFCKQSLFKYLWANKNCWMFFFSRKLLSQRRWNCCWKSGRKIEPNHCESIDHMFAWKNSTCANWTEKNCQSVCVCLCAETTTQKVSARQREEVFDLIWYGFVNVTYVFGSTKQWQCFVPLRVLQWHQKNKRNKQMFKHLCLVQIFRMDFPFFLLTHHMQMEIHVKVSNLV